MKFLDRESSSLHNRLIELRQFDIVHLAKVHDTGGIDPLRLASRFKQLSDDDLTARSVYNRAVT